MNKIIAIILFASTVLFICCYAAIDRYHKTLGDSHCFTIKETYNIFNDDELVINIYDNEKDSLINYATNAEAYLESKDETDVCKIKVKSVSISQQVLFEEELFNEYSLALEIDVNEITINDCVLKLIYPNQEINFQIGEVNIMERPNSVLTGIRGLYGLSFNSPFLSLGGVALVIENNSPNVLKINNISLGSSHSIGWQKLDNFQKDFTRIEDLCDYQYNITKTCVPLEIAANSTQTILLIIGYDNNVCLRETPIFFQSGDEMTYIDTFCFISTNDLNEYKSIIYEGYLHEF